MHLSFSISVPEEKRFVKSTQRFVRNTAINLKRKNCFSSSPKDGQATSLFMERSKAESSHCWTWSANEQGVTSDQRLIAFCAPFTKAKWAQKRTSFVTCTLFSTSEVPFGFGLV